MVIHEMLVCFYVGNVCVAKQTLQRCFCRTFRRAHLLDIVQLFSLDLDKVSAMVPIEAHTNDSGLNDSSI